jgi:hypothetical protein
MRMTDPIWLMQATKKDIERRALQDMARWIVYAVLFGLCLMPVVMPWN